MATELVLATLISVATAAVYVTVGRAVSRRPLRGDELLANQLFATWWYGLAGISVFVAPFTLAAAAGHTNLALHVALLNLVIVFLCVALWGLTYYLGYLFFGRRALLVPLGIVYGALMFILFYLIQAANPIGVSVGTWQVAIEYEFPFAGEPRASVILVALLLPPLLGALAYMSLYFRLREPEQKYRVAVISLTVLVWFGSSIVAALAGWSAEPAWTLVSRGLSLLAALAFLAAFQPPGFIRRRLARPPPIAAPGEPTEGIRRSA